MVDLLVRDEAEHAHRAVARVLGVIGRRSRVCARHATDAAGAGGRHGHRAIALARLEEGRPVARPGLDVIHGKVAIGAGDLVAPDAGGAAEGRILIARDPGERIVGRRRQKDRSLAQRVGRGEADFVDVDQHHVAAAVRIPVLARRERDAVRAIGERIDARIGIDPADVERERRWCPRKSGDRSHPDGTAGDEVCRLGNVG